MKFAEVLDTDMKMLAQLINMLQAGEFKLSGKDMCASADTIRWLQRVATQAAECYSGSKTVKEPEIVKPSDTLPPSSGLGEGVALKAFNPGKPSRSK